MTRRVAIVGASFRFPQTNAAQFWEDLLAGRNFITTVDPDRWSTDAFLHPNRKHPGTTYTFAAGTLGDVTGFDADFFGISPREAVLMDPQQRLLLELSWEVLENASVKPTTLRGSACGVFLGIASADYSYRFADDLASVDSSFATGNTNSIAANRLSYIYDLRGPSMAIDTACSSALVAFHQACRSIASGECSQALTGGISLHLHPFGFISFSKASMLSRQGRCRVFDASGDGYVRSEGGGLFLLKDYDLALADGNPILAVVAHTAVNTDGRKSGLTVPSASAQRDLLEQAYASVGIDPMQVDYIEAHGTGTAVGDPIETQALGKALGRHRPKGQPLPIGSIKSNLGHLEAASAVAGLVKVLHCLRYRTVPATIGMETPNPNIPFSEWNLEVVTTNRALRPSGKLVIGINSFGFGGANAHAILENPENHARAAPRIARGSELPVLVSGKTPDALKCAARELANRIVDQPEKHLYDIAHQTVNGREWHEHRALVFASTPQFAAEALRRFADAAPELAGVETATRLIAASGAAFIYSGNGSQWTGMGKSLLGDPVFRKAVREVDKLFAAYADFSLEAELLGANRSNRYEVTEVAQPALFALQVGITQMLRQRGLMPTAVVGHSVGEVAAAWASGALSLATAVQVIFHRSRLQGTTKGAGRMIAVKLGERAARELLGELGLGASLCLAGINSRRGVTIAGEREPLLQFQRVLAQRAISHQPLDLDYAFHSPAMEGIAPRVRESLAGIDPAQTQIPFYSTVTGGLLDGHELGADYWWRNIREPVLFEPALAHMVGDGINIFLEIGPHALLRGYVGDCLNDAGIEGRVIATGKRDDDSPQRIWSACSQAILAGATSDWTQLFPWRGQPFELPNYPWQRQRYWHSVSSESLGLLERHKIHPLLGSRLAQHDLTWESQLDTTCQPVLADHIVGDTTVFPGAGFAELALAAAFASGPGEVAEVEDLEIRVPLTLSDERAKTLRLAIDAQDGNLTIRAREYASGEAWTTHAVGRVLREPRKGRLGEALLELPTREPDFTGHSHEALTRSAGLAYGPSFSAIEHGWVDGVRAVAVFQIPDAVQAELGNYHLHPALLDCAFQLTVQLLKDEATYHEGWAFVPTRVGHITCRSGAAPRFARATLISCSPRSMTAEFTLFDENLRSIAHIEGARFRSIRLQKRSAAEELQYLHYQAIPRPIGMASDATACIPFERVREAMEQAVRHCEQEGTHRLYSEEVDPLLDSLCAHFTFEALREMAQRAGKSWEAVAAEASLETAPYFRQLLPRAQEVELQINADAESVLASKQGQLRAQDIWNSLIQDYPDYFPIVHAVGRIGMHLGALFDGNRRLDELWPIDSSLSSLMRKVLGVNAKTDIGKALRDLTTMALAELPEGRRLGIIEISEAGPVFATDICGALDLDRGDYFFASTADATIEAARHFQEKYPAINLACIEADRSVKETAPPPCAIAQLAIVTLDFQSTLNAARAIEYARSRLTPGGSMLVIGFHPSRWVDFVHGVRADRRNGTAHHNSSTPQQSLASWREQLKQLGLTTITHHEFAPGCNCGPYLLVAQLDRRGAVSSQLAPRLPSNWLIVTDKGSVSADLSEDLAERLMERGDRVVHLHTDDAAEFPMLLRQAVTHLGSVDGLAYLSGLDSFASDGDAALLLQTQVDRCATAAAIARTCEDTKTNTTCWLITSGAAGDLLPARNARKEAATTTAVAAASLWGFGRTLSNETSNMAVRLVDLENPGDAKMAAAALEREFLHQNPEDEILITAAGERFAPRLRFAPRPDMRPQGAARPQAVESVHLGFAIPGQLRNLRWEAHERRAPAPLEVEIAVRATGLNFRDVMYALGMLSDEAVENGFAGASLGLEFSGVVIGVGVDVADYAPGDRVVGFGPSSFADRVLTHVNAISRIPQGLSFEAAATIPSTFFTAYYALHHLARLGFGEKVLIHGAAGGVGIAAIQVAKWCGAEIFATAGSAEKRDFLHLLGVDHVLDSRTLAFADEILSATGGEGIDVVLNSLAGEAINRNLRILKPFGRFIELGKRDFYENNRIGLRPFRNNISYFGIDADQLMSARPELTHLLFGEIMALFRKGVLHPLPYHVFGAEDVVDAFRYMQQSRHIGKIVITYGSGIPDIHRELTGESRKLSLPPDATYLVTGGMRGFGLRTAQWLAQRGARHLVLVGRNGALSEEARSAIDALEQLGVQVIACACDVTDRWSLQQLMQRISVELPPLKGVVHAAMVIDDGLIRNMEAGQIRRVLAPKVLGALHLHELTKSLPLDFFVLYSSATTLFGNPGQGNYIAANAALETLARKRRLAGLPATCIRWGAIDDVGYLARNTQIKEAFQGRTGGSALQSSVALETLETMLLTDRSDLAVLDLDWTTLSRFLPSSTSTKFTDLARRGAQVESTADAAVDIARLLAERSDEELVDTFSDMLKEELGVILRVAPEKLDPTRSVYDMGFDSLMGVELIVAMESRFGIRLSIMALSETPTITKLANRIIVELRAAQSVRPPAVAADDVSRRVEQVVSQHDADFSAEEIRRFAEKIKSGETATQQRLIH